MIQNNIIPKNTQKKPKIPKYSQKYPSSIKFT